MHLSRKLEKFPAVASIRKRLENGEKSDFSGILTFDTSMQEISLSTKDFHKNYLYNFFHWRIYQNYLRRKSFLPLSARKTWCEYEQK